MSQELVERLKKKNPDDFKELTLKRSDMLNSYLSVEKYLKSVGEELAHNSRLESLTISNNVPDQAKQLALISFNELLPFLEGVQLGQEAAPVFHEITQLSTLRLFGYRVKTPAEIDLLIKLVIRFSRLQTLELSNQYFDMEAARALVNALKQQSAFPHIIKLQLKFHCTTRDPYNVLSIDLATQGNAEIEELFHAMSKDVILTQLKNNDPALVKLEITEATINLTSQWAGVYFPLLGDTLVGNTYVKELAITGFYHPAHDCKKDPGEKWLLLMTSILDQQQKISKSLPPLEILDLSNNNLKTPHLKYIIQLCAMCPTLQVLKLDKNGFDNEGIFLLIDAINQGKLPNLTTIYLRKNRQLDKEGVIVFAKEVNSNRINRIEFIYTIYKKEPVTPQAAKKQTSTSPTLSSSVPTPVRGEIPPSVSANSETKSESLQPDDTLQILQQNQTITDPAPKPASQSSPVFLPPSETMLDRLKRNDPTLIRLETKGVKNHVGMWGYFYFPALGRALVGNTYLKELALIGFTDPCHDSVKDPIEKWLSLISNISKQQQETRKSLPLLEILNLSNNNLNTKQFRVLLYLSSKLSTLRTLNLDFNDLDEEAALLLVNAINEGKFPNLITITLRNNPRFNDEGAAVFKSIHAEKLDRTIHIHFTQIQITQIQKAQQTQIGPNELPSSKVINPSSHARIVSLSVAPKSNKRIIPASTSPLPSSKVARTENRISPSGNEEASVNVENVKPMENSPTETSSYNNLVSAFGEKIKEMSEAAHEQMIQDMREIVKGWQEKGNSSTPTISFVSDFNKEKQTQKWLKSLMEPINANNGKQNCVHTAIALQRAITEKSEKGASVIAQQKGFELMNEGDNSTKIIYRLEVWNKKFRDSLNSVQDEIEIEEKLITEIGDKGEVYIDLTTAVSSSNSVREKHHARFTVMDRNELIKTLKSLPRGEDNTVSGYVYYTLQPESSSDTELRRGHLANFFVNRNDEVYFLDAQDKTILTTPKTHCSITQRSYLANIGFITCRPQQGFKHENNETPKPPSIKPEPT